MSALLTAIFARHKRSLLWVVTRIVRDPQVAEDLAQEAYLKTYQALEKNVIDKPEHYIFQTARNLALDYNRKTRFRGQFHQENVRVDDLQNLPHEVPSAEENAIECDQRRLFEKALSELPLRAREAWSLTYLEGLNYQEVAERLGVSRNTVYNDIKLVIGYCRDYLERFEKN
ncbi:RNA polymerase sigma factor [Brucellaceae bacterium C25G]